MVEGIFATKTLTEFHKRKSMQNFNILHVVICAVAFTSCNIETPSIPSSDSNSVDSLSLIRSAGLEIAALDNKLELSKQSAQLLNTERSKFTQCDGNNSEHEVFDFNEINNQLGQLPSLQKILKLNRVTNCADSKRFVQKKYEIIERNFPSEILNTDTPNTAFEKTSIRSGTIANHAGFVSLRLISGRICGGSLISPSVVVTSAHCLAHELAGLGISGKDARAPFYGFFYFSPNLKAADWYDLPTGDSARFIIHEPYVGDGDTQSDIGLIIIDRPIISTKEYDYLNFYVGTMSNGRRNKIWGIGVDGFSGNGSGIPRFGSEYVDWYGSYHFYATESGGMRVCAGDSGGPWIREDNSNILITGITSNIDVASSGSQLCTTAGGRMRACRASAKISWISSKMTAYEAGWCTTVGDIATCH